MRETEIETEGEREREKIFVFSIDMPLHCSSPAAVALRMPGNGRTINKFTPNHVGSLFFCHSQKSSKRIIVSLSKFNSSAPSSIMEEHKNMGVASSEAEKYYEELNVAVRAVQMACALCQRVQDGLISKSSNGQVQSKDDNSPVTVAGNSANPYPFFLIWVLFTCAAVWLFMYFGRFCFSFGGFSKFFRKKCPFIRICLGCTVAVIVTKW